MKIGKASTALVVLTAVVALTGCGSGKSAAHKEIQYGTPAATIAKTFGLCARPVSADGAAKCEYPNGEIVLVNKIDGPADQQLELPAARQNDFCELVGHGFGITGTSYTELHRHVDVNKIVSTYGGKLAGGGC